MLSYCFKCRKNTESKNPIVARTKNGRIMLLSTCALCDSKKSKFIKWQEASRLLCSFAITIPLNEICLFKSKFLLATDKFLSEIDLRHPEFTYSARVPFTKIKERIKNFKETEDSRYICQNELEKACFQHVMPYGEFENLTRRKDKVLRNKAFNIAKNPKYDRYQCKLASMVYKFWNKKTSGSGIKIENMSDH